MKVELQSLNLRGYLGTTTGNFVKLATPSGFFYLQKWLLLLMPPFPTLYQWFHLHSFNSSVNPFLLTDWRFSRNIINLEKLTSPSKLSFFSQSDSSSYGGIIHSNCCDSVVCHTAFYLLCLLLFWYMTLYLTKAFYKGRVYSCLLGKGYHFILVRET